MKKVYRNLILFSILLISVIMHWNHFPKDLMSFHVWRQTQTQSTINNYFEEDMNILNPRRNDRGNGDGIFRMEFPMMQWMVACLYKMTGKHVIVSRIFNFITGLSSILALFLLLKLLFKNEVIAVIGAWTFNFSPGFYYYTINPMPDNFALCCSLWGIVLFFYWHQKQRNSLLLCSSLLLSFGTLCKLPFIVYYSVPLGFFLIQTIKWGLNRQIILNTSIILLSILLPFSWYLMVVPNWGGNGIVQGIFSNHIPTPVILYYICYNLFSTLPELLLNYGSLVFFLAGFYFVIKKKTYRNKFFPLLALWSISLVAFFLFEVNMIAKAHDYYLFPFFPVLFILVSYGAYHLLSLKSKFMKYIVFFLLLLLPVTAWLRNQDRWDPQSPDFNKDLLEYKNELRDAVPGDALCIAGNDESHFIFFYYIDKKGWGFQSDTLNPAEMENMIKEGAEYLYSDSRLLENNDQIKPLIDSLVMERGSIKIFRLKSN